MNLNQYVQDAIRTESRIDEVKTDRLVLQNALQSLIAAGTILDGIKKNVFYGKPIEDYQEQAVILRNTGISAVASGFTHESVVDIDPRVFHSLIGVITEASELAEALLIILITGSSDDVNILEEFGDIGWYEAIGIDALGGDFEEILNTNIEKLRKRFPEKFTSEHAIERNVDEERNILDKRLSS